MVSGGDARDPVLVESLLDEPLDRLVVFHEGDVADVDEQEDESLPPMNPRVPEEEDEGDEGHGVEGTVTEERPPGQVEDRLRKQGTHPNNKQNVEDRRP